MNFKEIAVKLNAEYGNEFLRNNPDFKLTKSELEEMIEVTLWKDSVNLSDYDSGMIINEWSRIVEFNWNNYALIARVLNVTYPFADLVEITSEEVEELTMALDNYNPMVGESEPDQIDAILYSWINELGDEFDDSMHDPYV